MGIHDEYAKKNKSAEDAVKIVKNGDWVDYGMCCTFPEDLDNALSKRKDELRDVKVRNAISMKPAKVVTLDPEQKSFSYNLWHCSGIDRKYVDKGQAFFSPMLFRNCGSYYTKGYAPVDVAMITVAPMDKNGNFSFGPTNGCMREMVSAAEYIIVEVNKNIPKVYGMENDYINIKDIDCVVESEKNICTVPKGTVTTIDRKIANQIFPYLYDGITLQLGIGGMPNALGELIAKSDLKNLGMHTELMSDGYLALYKAGKITNTKKPINIGKGVFSIATGSKELYEYMNENIELLSAPMFYVNNPKIIKDLDHFVSINGCISMDLYGQICSESAGTRHISGTGGQLDFITGAYVAQHGQAFLAMSSAFTDKDGAKHSRILPKFENGDIITTPRTQTMNIVTEYGVANLVGISTWQRAEKIVNIAHPDFRDELIKAAEKQKIWRQSNKK